MRIVIFITTLVVIVFNSMTINAQTTVQDYIDLEELRLIKADSINTLIDTYVTANLANYNLTQNEISNIINDLSSVHDAVSEPITGNALEIVLLNAKKSKIRQEYYQQNPNDLAFFQPTQIPVELRQSCINGDFESGYVNYSFTQRNIITLAHLNPGCVGTDANMVAFQPLGLDNFNANASLVSPGNEPLLASLNIPVNRVLSGTRSLKLNPTPIDQPDSQTGNRTAISRGFIINENQIEFSFLYLGHTNFNHNSAYFRYRLIDNITGTILFNNCINTWSNDCRFVQIADTTYGNNTLNYTPNWNCERIDTSNLIGRDVTLEFSVSDCEFRGHFSTVYIDNICGVSCSPTWGNLIIDPINLDCPDSNIDVCGTFELPPGTNSTSFILNVIDDSDGSTISTYPNPSITGNNYCFNVDISDFGATPSGQFSFDVILNNDSNCNIISQITASGGLVNFDDCIDPCNDIINISISGTTLSWDSLNSEFELEFNSNGLCCGGTNTMQSETYTTTLNQFDFLPFVNILSSNRCFSFKIKSSCGEWSDWCCIEKTNNDPLSFIINTNNCTPVNPCENFDNLILENNSDDNILTGQSINHNTFNDIIASNIVEDGAIVTYEASNSIRLIPEFHAENISNQNNGSFIARIIPCEPAIIPPQTRLASSEKLNEVKVYPNPASNILNITSKKIKLVNIQLLDIYGNTLQNFKKINTNKYSLSVDNYSRGYYLLKITLEDGSTQIKTVILK